MRSRGYFHKFQRYWFPFMERIVIQFFPQEHWRRIIFFCILTFFRSSCLKSRHKAWFIIWDRRPQKIELAKVLKTIILPSSVNRCIRQIFKTFWILVILSRFFLSFRSSLLYQKWTPVIFRASLLHESIPFMPQTAIFTVFSTPKPEILHFSWFGSKPEFVENVADILLTSVIDLLFLKRKRRIVCVSGI